MEKAKRTTNPTVSTLASGNALVAKQMQANAGDILPEHLANLESILMIQQGECIFRINNQEQILKEGETIVVPSNTKHQITAITNFKAVHFMPKNIKFEFFA